LQKQAEALIEAGQRKDTLVIREKLPAFYEELKNQISVENTPGSNKWIYEEWEND